MGLAALLGIIVVLRLARRDGERTDVQSKALLAGYLAAVVGAQAFESLLAVPAAIAAHDARLLLAGRASYGALLGGAAGTVAVLRGHGASNAAFFDRAAACAGFVFALLRLGCLLDGCDYGHVTGGWLGVSFPPGSSAALHHASRGFVPEGSASLPVYPTPVFEAVLAIVASACVLPRVLRGERSGAAALRCAFVYAGGRFFVELLKEHDGSPVLGLFPAQWVSVALVIGCAVVGWRMSAHGIPLGQGDRRA